MFASGKASKMLAQEAMLIPQEEMLEVAKRKQDLFIGIPKETNYQENRVALTPEAVDLLVNNGHQVVIQRGAGLKANFTDNEYSEAGAEIGGIDRVFEADTILKIAPPTEKEIDLMKPGQTILTAMQLAVQLKGTLQKLMEKRVTAIAWDFMRDEDGAYPIVRTMGEIAGTTSVLIAAELMNNYEHGHGMMMGGVAGVRPCEVVIIGAGTVGQFAALAALGLGASVKVFDSSMSRLRRLQQDVGHRVFTSVIKPTVLGEALVQADVAIGAIRSTRGMTPVVATEEMVMKMKRGAVIVDVSIDRGGCFETSKSTDHLNPTFTVHDVVHYCVPNIASRVSRTASFALSNIFAPILLEMADAGGCKSMLRQDSGFRQGAYLFQGKLTNKLLADTFDIPYSDMDLLIAAF